ncbi:MAG: NUDIX hydrolase [Oscillospiraceae bacterium]|nr:NUDIX hydrolase [Oscillospiraceae bacterium]
MNTFEKTLSEERVYDGKILRIRRDTVELPNKNEATREVIEHNGGVCVLPLTDGDEVIMVKQFRYPFGGELLEIPAGKLEVGEDPLVCGKRELLEETGCTADSYEYLGKLYPTPAYCTEVIHMYLARGIHEANGDSLTYKGNFLDSDEFLNVVKLPFDKVIDMIFRNEISDAKTQISMLKTKILLNN